MAVTFTAKFDLDSDSATFGKFVLTDTTNWVAEGYAPANVKGFWNLVYPDLSTRTGSIATPDINGGAIPPDFVFDTLAIPNTTAGGYLTGEYKFQLFVEIDDGVNPVVNLQSTQQKYTFCPPSTILDETTGLVKDVNLQYEIDCICQKITLTDDTNYGTYDSLTRLLTLHPPSIAAEADATSTNKTLVYQFSYVNAAYEFYANNLVTYTSGIFTVVIRLKANIPVIVNCDFDRCALYKCTLAYKKIITDKVKAGAGYLSPKDANDLMWLVGKEGSFQQALDCGQNDDVITIYDEIKAFLKIAAPGCDCGCGDKTTPKKVDPYCAGAGGGTTYTFLATFPVKRTVAGANITYYLDTDFVNKVNALYETIVASADGSVTVAPSGTDPKTYDLSVQQYLAFTLKISFGGGISFVTAFSNINKKGNAYKDQAGNWTIATKQAFSMIIPCVLKFGGFRTTLLGAGIVLPDKIFIESTDIQYLDDPDPGVAGKLNHDKQVAVEVVGKDNDNIYFRLVDSITGNVWSVQEFVNILDHITIDFKIIP